MSKALFIPYLLRDGAILQQNKPISFWGYAPPNNRVEISYENTTLAVQAECITGYFEFTLPPHNAGGPIDFKIYTAKEEIVIRNILFGDVWLLGGQSNMELCMNQLRAEYPNEITQADNSLIRFFQVPEQFDFKGPQNELTCGQWKSAIGKDLETLSGIGYFFAKQQYKEKHIPIGLVSTAVGGSPIKSWVSHETLLNLGLLPNNFDCLRNNSYIELIEKNDTIYQQQYQNYCEKVDNGLSECWMYTEFDDTSWDHVKLNQAWPNKYCTSGVIWLRKRITIPDSMVGYEGELRFGTLIDSDDIFINGKKIGSTDHQYLPRNYPLGILKKEFEMVIRLRIYNSPGGIRKTKQHLIVTKDEILDVDTLGSWAIKRGSWLPERKSQLFLQYKPIGLFNGMIHPLRRIPLTGILWYQGESDTGNPEYYGSIFTNMIQEWRKIFNQPYLPFLFVQLPNYDIEPEHDWARLREEQKKGLLINDTAMIVSIEMGEDDDLHPTRKKDVAIALAKAFKNINSYHNGYCNGPLAIYAYQMKNQIVIKFQTFGVTLSGNENGFFELIDDTRSIKLLTYTINENEISVELPFGCTITRGARIRYNWGNAPKPFIRDITGAPAAPFEVMIRSVLTIPFASTSDNDY
ncbi:MAG: hypothetical protein H6Q70_989 [Firmicutes bacterium]|nr:hypothetical protein [Bacillota bacterium]